MKDGLVDTVKKDVKAAESGDEAAQQRLRNELFPLSRADRTVVAAKLENETGVSIVRDKNQAVRSITFSPTPVERIEGYFTIQPMHAIKITSR